MEKTIIEGKLTNVKKFRNVLIAVGLLVLLAGVGYFVVSALQCYNWKCATRFSDNPPTFLKFCLGGWLDNFLVIPLIASACICVVICALGIFLYKSISKTSLTVTDKRVYGKAAFGSRVDLPIDSISAVGMSAFKGISVSSPSGIVSFICIKNNEEVHKAISALLLNRQKASPASEAVTSVVPQSNADELKKYKELLDGGVITQEEFDKKKKQLLGL